MRKRKSHRAELVAAAIIAFIFAVSFMLGFMLGNAVHLDFEKTDSNVAEEIVPPSIAPVVETVYVEPMQTPDPRIYFDVPLSTELQDYIRKVCEDRNVPMALIIAMIQAESNFQADVISKTNDYGLMQINISNHTWLSRLYGVSNFLDPFSNVYCGINMLGDLMGQFSTTEEAVIAYNKGAGGAKALFAQGIYSTPYSENVMAAYQYYSESALVSSVDIT